MPGSFDSALPGMNKQKLKRFFQRFSVLFGRLDKGGAKQPQYLVFGGSALADTIFAHADAAMQQMPNGASFFVQNYFSNLVDYQDRLEKAVGVEPAVLAQLSLAAAKDLSAAVSQSDELVGRSAAAAEKVEALLTTVTTQQATLQEMQRSSKADVDAIAMTRNRAEKLLSVDGRQKDSLESLIRRIQGREAEIVGVLEASTISAENVVELQTKAHDSSREIERIHDSLVQTEQEAKRILSVSAQAGLARSYLAESAKLQSRSNVFTILLYSSAILVVVLAAFYVLPALETAVKTNDQSYSQRVTVILLRASILAPLVYLLYFTSKQIGATEALRMDYAEKAAASLAYSGYRDEMSEDHTLLERLRGSLLLKFAEHPERLLRKGGVRESISVDMPGFKASASSGDKGPSQVED
jgi:hypothetical protein